jgi:hypothetical protein
MAKRKATSPKGFTKIKVLGRTLYKKRAARRRKKSS